MNKLCDNYNRIPTNSILDFLDCIQCLKENCILQNLIFSPLTWKTSISMNIVLKHSVKIIKPKGT